MLIREVEVKKADGIQHKDSAVFVQRAMRYDSEILVEFGTKKINAKSLMGVISLGLKPGSKIMLIAKGEDEDDAINELQHLIERNFIL